jgi:hypothetical protein
MAKFQRITIGLLFFLALGIASASVQTQQPKKEGKRMTEVRWTTEENGHLAGHVTHYLYLTHTDAKKQIAYTHRRVTRGEKKLVAAANADFNRFRITDETGKEIFLQARVIRVDSRVLYFQKEKSMYGWQIGTSLNEALRRALNSEELKDANLQIDQDYAKEMAQTKKKK